MTLYEAMQLFLEESGRCRTPTSRNTYRKELQSFSRFCQKRLKAITGDDLAAYCLHDTPADATVRKRRAVLLTFFGWLHWRKEIHVDPSAGLKYAVRPGNAPVRTHTWLSQSEAVKALSWTPLTYSEARARMIFAVGVFTGLRAAELAALTWGQFSKDLDELVLVGKGRKLATIGVPPQLQDELREWRKTAHGHAVFPALQFATTDVVLHDCPIGVDMIAAAVRLVGNRIGVKLAPHDMRRTFAGILEDQGFPIEDISRALRHENIATTQKYLANKPEKTVAVGRRFELR